MTTHSITPAAYRRAETASAVLRAAVQWTEAHTTQQTMVRQGKLFAAIREYMHACDADPLAEDGA